MGATDNNPSTTGLYNQEPSRQSAWAALLYLLVLLALPVGLFFYASGSNHFFVFLPFMVAILPSGVYQLSRVLQGVKVNKDGLSYMSMGTLFQWKKIKLGDIQSFCIRSFEDKTTGRADSFLRCKNQKGEVFIEIRLRDRESLVACLTGYGVKQGEQKTSYYRSVYVIVIALAAIAAGLALFLFYKRHM